MTSRKSFHICTAALAASALLTTAPPATTAVESNGSAVVRTRRSLPAGEAEVRRAVEQVFERLRAGQYDALYNQMPISSQRRIKRERFISGLRRTQGIYSLDRLKIGQVRHFNDVALVDTVMYGRILRPVESMGKIVAQQLLVREGGEWRVATGDSAVANRLRAAAGQRVALREPRFFVQQNGRWIEMGSPTHMR